MANILPNTGQRFEGIKGRSVRCRPQPGRISTVNEHIIAYVEKVAG